MGENAYFGEGNGWGGEGPEACAAWLKPHPEYSQPLGEPTGPASLTGSVFTRKFSSGTTVMIDGAKNGDACVLWAGGYETGDTGSCRRARRALAMGQLQA